RANPSHRVARHISDCENQQTAYEERGASEQRPAIEAEPIRQTLPRRNRRWVDSGFLAGDAQILFDRRFVRRNQTRTLVAENGATKSIRALCSVRLIEQLGR